MPPDLLVLSSLPNLISQTGVHVTLPDRASSILHEKAARLGQGLRCGT
jgi:hypothetical protein